MKVEIDLEYLNKLKEKALNCEAFLVCYPCKKCGKLTNKTYCCIHCNYSGDDSF